MTNPAKHKTRNSHQKGRHILNHRLQLVHFVAIKAEFFAHDYLLEALFPQHPQAFLEELNQAFHNSHSNPELGYRIQKEIIPQIKKVLASIPFDYQDFLPQGEEKIRDTLQGSTRHIDELPSMLIHSLQILSYFV